MNNENWVDNEVLLNIATKTQRCFGCFSPDSECVKCPINKHCASQTEKLYLTWVHSNSVGEIVLKTTIKYASVLSTNLDCVHCKQTIKRQPKDTPNGVRSRTIVKIQADSEDGAFSKGDHICGPCMDALNDQYVFVKVS